MAVSSYRPHNPGHDYYDAGIYLITLVVTGREQRLGCLNNNLTNPAVVHSVTGDIVYEEWAKTAVIQASKGHNIKILNQVCMPDHWHGVIHIKERMDISLGDIIQSFKSACTSRWRREVTGYVEPTSTATMIRSIGKKKRRDYYSTRPLIERPLFDDDYDDTICFDEEHCKRMIAYVSDNPRRAIYRRQYPLFMQRQMHVMIDGTEYAAFGNLFLLRWARKVQVLCHRKARLHQLTPEERKHHGYAYAISSDMTTKVPYELTDAYREEHDSIMSQVLQGATVIVTPGISKGEQKIKDECLEHGIPLIHLQQDPISPYWKPEEARFNACTHGNLLILAPWQLDAMPSYGDIPSTALYSHFHNLNTLAACICAFDGDAKIIRTK